MMTIRLVAVALATILVWSCAGNGAVGVQLDEYSLDAASGVPSGDVTFRAHNTGDIEHQLVVLRTTRRPDDLPVEDAEVREDARGVVLAGETSTIEPGATMELTLRLRPGRYVLICNVPGHYQSGMRTAFRAT